MARRADPDKPDTQHDKIDKYLLSPGSIRDTGTVGAALSQVPLTLQPFFRENTDLNRELVQRFPNMPLISVIRFRDLYGDGERGVATLASQDGSASLIVDVTSLNNDIQFSFTYGSMLSLRFYLDELSDKDRDKWLDDMEAQMDNIVPLWGQSRWAKDYVICVPHRYYVSLLAFSPNNFEAAVRLTPSLSNDLLAWLKSFWKTDKGEDDANDDTNAILGGW